MVIKRKKNLIAIVLKLQELRINQDDCREQIRVLESKIRSKGQEIGKLQKDLESEILLMKNEV